MTATVKLDAILALIQVGIPIVANIVAAIKARKLVVTERGRELTAEDVQVRCDKAVADALAAGDSAADRIDGRHD